MPVVERLQKPVPEHQIGKGALRQLAGNDQRLAWLERKRSRAVPKRRVQGASFGVRGVRLEGRHEREGGQLRQRREELREGARVRVLGRREVFVCGGGGRLLCG